MRWMLASSTSAILRLSARKIEACIEAPGHSRQKHSQALTLSCAGGGIRTPDSRIMIPLLYHLSYAGSAMQN